jgi:1,2-diacylglycerol 3-beta-galactosyltransferase
LPAPTVDFIYFEAGGGHRSAALALQSVIKAADYPWQVRLVNLQEVLDSLDIFRKVTGVRLEDLYNRMLAKGWTLGSDFLLKAMHLVIRVYHPAQVRLLTDYWMRTRPDLVVSLVPNFNRALFESLGKASPRTPLITVLTDLADYPPHFWMEKQPDQYFICGTKRAYEQALEIGHPPERIFQVSGMILRPPFYQVGTVDRAAERTKLGLEPNVPTALVLFGGEGSNAMYSIAERLGNSQIGVQMVMICGRNANLKARLEKLRTRNRIFVEGFTKEIPYYMSLCDFFIGKPGPGSISEALKMNLPVIVEQNAWTLPQERFNAEWVRDQGVGMVLPSFAEIQKAVETMLQPGRLDEMRSRIAQHDNQAVYEVPRIIDQVLHRDGILHAIEPVSR